MEMFTFGVNERATGKHLGRVWVGAESVEKAGSYAMEWAKAGGYDLEGDWRQAVNLGPAEVPDGYVSFNRIE